MQKKFILATQIVAGNYVFLSILSFIFRAKWEVEFIATWGLLPGIILLIVGSPGSLSFGLSSTAAPSFPNPEKEHLLYKMRRDYRKDLQGETKKERNLQGAYVIAGLIIIVTSVLLS